MRVLIVDDDPDCRQIVGLMIGKQGWTLASATNGLEALAVAAEFRPDLVLMDILMPELSGLEAARAMRADAVLGGTPLIALTALAFEADRRQAIASGFDAVITKPFGRRQLLEAIARLCPEARILDARAPEAHQIPA